jgi:hypothetical protein
VRTRGATFVEILIATLILSVCIGSLFGVWQYAFGTYLKSNEVAAASNVVRGTIEGIKVNGFLHYPTGTVNPLTEEESLMGAELSGTYTAPPVYYDRLWQESTAANATYRLNVVSEDWDVAESQNISGGYEIMRTTRRTVTATVTKVADGVQLISMGTILVRGGI